METETETVIREALCGLCHGYGWSYGVCWQFDRRDPRLLVMGDSYYEKEEIGTVIDKMITQVHFVGEGTIGVAAVSGRHQWIHSDTSRMELSWTSANDNVGTFKRNAEWQHQFLAGMKTIAIISLPSFGVVQFGSTHKIHESFGLVCHARHLFCQLGATKEHYIPEHPCKSTEICYPSEGLASLISCRQSYASCKSSINSLHDVLCNEQHYNAVSSSSPIPTSTHFSLKSQASTGSHIWSMNPIDSISSSMNQFLEPQTILHPDSNMQSTNSCSCNSISANLNTMSLSASSRMNLCQNYLGDSSNGRRGPSQVMIRSSEKLLGSSLASSSKSSSKSSSLTSELPNNFLSFIQDSDLEFQFKDQMDQVHPCEQSSEHVSDSLNLPVKDKDASVQCETVGCSSSTVLPGRTEEISVNSLPDTDMFDGMELQLSPGISRQECWDDIIIPVDVNSYLDFGGVSYYNSDKRLFSGSHLEQQLEAVVGESANVSSSHISIPTIFSPIDGLGFQHQHSNVCRTEHPQANTNPTPFAAINLEKVVRQHSEESNSKSHVSSWIEDSCATNAESVITNQPKRPEETVKVVRKKVKPGEHSRPRPKDRQHTQDRIKELRQIVPNSTKCSIDSLLERTIKHTLFLQSVKKYADKLKQTDLEPKMIGDAVGVVLIDKSPGSGSGGGATWTYEVASQRMVYPISVEDINPPAQMLVEMLCEERGFFLEIADVIRGIGLTILKGGMEIRDSKIWARFLVDADKEVTRLDIFFALVRLLQQTSSTWANDSKIKAQEENGANTTLMSMPIGVTDRSSTGQAGAWKKPRLDGAQ